MLIDKVSWIIEVHNISRSSSASSCGRRVLMSLPRVKWLERDPDYVVPPPVTENPTENTLRRAARPLANREMEAYEHRRRGLSYAQISMLMGASENAARSYVSSARKKIQRDKSNVLPGNN